MADQQGLSAPFPAPPPFYQHFTKHNLSRLRQLREEAGVRPSPDLSITSEANRSIDVLSLPPDLRYLIPPPPPAPSDKFRAFGASLELDAPAATLEESGIEQLYPRNSSVHSNPQPHLITLARSLLTTFLSLVGILSQNPTLYKERVEALQTISYNMHDLINQYRPHQARETLILMMEERIDRMREEMRGIEKGNQKVEEIVRGMVDEGEEQRVVLSEVGTEDEKRKGHTGGADGLTTKHERRQRAAWAALENMEAKVR